ncbi:MAG: hypothetical protein R2755_30755 [Acidimicrobiales bacterium]
MAYDTSDLRSQLSSAGAGAERAAGANVAPQYFEFERRPPTETTAAGSRSWWGRSQSCVFNHVEAAAGDPLTRAEQTDEYVVLLPDEHPDVTVTWGEQTERVTGRALVVVPPGASAVTAAAPTTVVRLFTTRSEELCARCDNAGFYATPDPNVAAYQPWPDPPAGHRIRVYLLDDVKPDPNRFGRLFRCSTLMVNYFYADPGPRDPAKLSPHHHDDFEQLSLQLAGDYVHHIRTPWTVDLARWRDDEHQHCTSPSITVIPPPSIHTSQGVGPGVHQLVDIFCPPRFDFSERPGWVLNAEEYPMPTR